MGKETFFRVYGFDDYTRPIIEEYVDGSWVEYKTASVNGYDGYMAHYDGDGTYSFSFVVDMSNGERTFRVTPNTNVAPDIPDEPDPETPTFNTTVLRGEDTFVFWEEGCSLVWNMTSFGHKFTVGEGYSVASIATGELVAAAADYVIKVYEWKGNYADTVAAEALYTKAFNNGAENASYTVTDIDVVLTGDLYWEVTKADCSASVTYFVSDHAESKGLGATFIDGAYTTHDTKCTITLKAVNSEDTVKPVALAGPAYLAVEAGAGNQMAVDAVTTENGRTFVRLTATGGDPYFSILNPGANVQSDIMAIAYRTNSKSEGEFYVGSGAGITARGDHFNVTWTEGDWNLLVIDLSTVEGLTSITDDMVNFLRIDFFTNAGEEGDYFDIEYVAFFKTVADAETYYNDLH